MFCVPETATCLLSSGIFFYDLNDESRINFQENLLKTLIQIEDTINETAKYYHTNRGEKVLIIYDRGAMDPVSCKMNKTNIKNLINLLLISFPNRLATRRLGNTEIKKSELE